MSNEGWKTYSRALEKLLIRPDLRSRFEQDTEGTMAPSFNISIEMADDLKRLLINVPDGSPPTQPEISTPDSDDLEKRAMSAQEFFETTFRHQRRAALITTTMSILIFLMGLVLLALAAMQSVRDQIPGTAVALAASGIGAIAAAFYKNPVEQMRVSASDMQRSSMILMTYMLGLSLLGKSLSGQSTAEEMERLTTLTSKLVGLLGGGEDEPPTSSGQTETGSSS